MKVGKLSYNKSGCSRSVTVARSAVNLSRACHCHASTTVVVRHKSALCGAVAMMTVLLQLVLLMVVPRGAHDAADALKARPRYGQYDAFFVARCEAHCWLVLNKSACIKSCLLKPFIKPGQCPKNDTILAPFDAVCMDTCNQDSQCFALTKCCRHSCGVTCQYPEKLLSAVGIPYIPRDVKVTEGPKKGTIQLDWRPGGLPQLGPKNGTILYLIEERHHTGHNFIEEHLSEWSLCARSVKTAHILKNFVKPGRWYQFRVAAINENGTKGFSENSPTFNVAIRPKPPKAPQNVTVTGLWSDLNGTLIGELRWLPPRSDLPIQRYKVFWNRRLHGAKPLDSVLVHQQVISKEQTKFLLQDLQPNSLYFLQIQALVQYGKNRLKGQKSGLVLNTTNYTNVTHTPTTKSFDKNKIEGLRVQKMYWSQDSLRVRIIWKPKKESLRYTVTLWTGPCYKSSKSSKYFKLAATTKATHFDLNDLQFNCKYRVGVRSVSEEGMKSVEDTSVTLVTPNCLDFKRTNRKARCTN